MKKLKETYGDEIAIRWRSYELRPAGSPPMPEDYRKRIEQNRPVLYARMKQDHGVDLNSGPFGINSRPSLIIEKYAEAQGVGEAFHNVTQAAYWLEGRDISDQHKLRKLMQQVNLDPTQFDSALANPDYDEEVSFDVAQAREYGLDGVPALVFNDKYLVMGAQPYQTLANAVEKLKTEI